MNEMECMDCDGMVMCSEDVTGVTCSDCVTNIMLYNYYDDDMLYNCSEINKK